MPALHSFAAPSFNGRTADSGSAYRGSNPWGAAKYLLYFLPVAGFQQFPARVCAGRADVAGLVSGFLASSVSIQLREMSDNRLLKFHVRLPFRAQDSARRGRGRRARQSCGFSGYQIQTVTMRFLGEHSKL